VSGSAKPDLRREHEMRLLRAWHDIIVDRGVKDYAWEQAERDYRTSALYSWVYVVIAMASLDPANERGVAFFQDWTDRRAKAAEDLDAGELLPR
jgi:hypothetical protein